MTRCPGSGAVQAGFIDICGDGYCFIPCAELFHAHIEARQANGHRQCLGDRIKTLDLDLEDTFSKIVDMKFEASVMVGLGL